MRLGYTILYVPNVTESVNFYEKAFGVQRRFVHESGAYAELETGGTALAFASAEMAPRGTKIIRADEAPVGIEIAFVTDDVPAAFERAVKGGAKALSKPETKPWGQTVSYLRDLDGVLVEICTPVSTE
jgi:lactoylglutathione lyase